MTLIMLRKFSQHQYNQPWICHTEGQALNRLPSG